MRITLDDAWAKLRWAEHHLNVLRADIEQFRQGNDYRITVDKNIDEARYSFKVRDLQPIKPDWGLVIGDCLHNARTSLDYLMVRLVSLVTGRRPEDIGDVQFPIYDSPKRLNGALGELRKELALSGYLTRIEELQPYNNGNASIWGTLPIEAFGAAWPVSSSRKDGTRQLVTPEFAPALSVLPFGLQRLCALDNIDKHRAIHVAWNRLDSDTTVIAGVEKQTYVPLTPPAGYDLQHTSRAIEPLEDGAEVGYFQFTVPIADAWTPGEMDMKDHFPIHVAIGDWQTGSAQPALDSLELCLWSTQMVLTIFGPVFERHRKPPLPVTVALPMDE